MKIEKIEIENFRGWNGPHEIKFSVKKDKPVTLIIAENGTGKSNILEAIMWCLHGKLPASAKEKDRIINYHALKKNKNIAASVKLTIIDDKESQLSKNLNPKYIISKEIRSGKPASSQIYELDPNRQKPHAYKRQEQLIERLLPERLSKFFLFSGEGIEQLFNDSQESQLIESIEDIQGLTFARKGLEDAENYSSFLTESLGKLNSKSKKSQLAAVAVKNATDVKNQLKLEKEDLEKEKEEKKKRLYEISNIIRNSGQKVLEQAQKTKDALLLNLNTNKADLIKFEKEHQTLLNRAPSIFLFNEKLSLDTFLSKNKLNGIIPAPHDEKFVYKLLDERICICGREICEDSEEEAKIKTLLDESGNETQHANLTALEGFMNNFNFENKKFRNEYEDKEEMINEKESNILSLQAKIDEQNKIISDTGIEDITKLQKEEEELSDRLLLLPSEISNKNIKINREEEEIKKNKKLIIEEGDEQGEELKNQIDFVEKCIDGLRRAIEETQLEGRESLINKLNDLANKFDTKDQEFKYANDSSYKPLMIDKELEAPLPENQGNTVLKSIFYATSLIDICKERFDKDETIIQPGTIAPMVCDAVFSALSVANTQTVTKLLCEIPEQTILMVNAVSYRGECEKVMNDLDIVGESYLFQRKQNKINKELSEIEVNGKKYNAFIADKDITTNTAKSIKF
tara:strand:- start:537 stop:2597 length:2061 start_codon:yes stop_codon:yes gene_type:complete